MAPRIYIQLRDRSPSYRSYHTLTKRNDCIELRISRARLTYHDVQL